jgi:hypothetical protein
MDLSISQTKSLLDIPLGKQEYSYMFDLQDLPKKTEDMPKENNKYSGCLYTPDGNMVCPKNNKNAWSVSKNGYTIIE